jgi:uncharacterized beta barrel domain-containing protein DUF5777
MDRFRTVVLCAALFLSPNITLAQGAAPAPQPPPERSDPDARVDPLQPDFNVVALPTTLRVPVHKGSFRVTHRFTRPIDQGNVGAFVDDLFGFDSAAQVGLELRYGLLPGTQIGVHRTSDRTIQIFGQHNFLKERDGKPVDFDAVATIEGGNNLTEFYQSALGIIVSRKVARRMALYAEPILVLNTNPIDSGDNNTMLLGLGGRLRVLPSMYLAAEISPRLAGYKPGVNQISFALDGRAGGHLFQVSVSNGFGTTLGQVARGGFTNDNWYIGFNIMRKFF